MIKNYLKIAFRNFKKHKVFTLINVVGLSIGVTTALVIYLIVNYDFTFDKFHKDGDQTYRVVSIYSFAGEPYYNGGVTGPLPDAVKNEVTGLAASAPLFTADEFKAEIPNGDKQTAKFKKQKGVAFTDSRLFDIFQFKWLAGSPKTSLSAPFQVVLTDKQAAIYFPNMSYNQIIGKQIVYEDTMRTTVSGVVEAFKQNTDLTVNAFISRETMLATKDLKDQIKGGWGGTTSASILFVKLNPKSSPAGIEKQLNALLKKYNPPKKEDKGSTRSLDLQKLSDVHFDERYSTVFDTPTANKKTLYGLIVIAAFILALGCINFINLTTAQGSQRAKEIGIRKTMGSSRKQLIGIFLSETFIVTLFAVIISICICPVVLKAFSNFIAKDIHFNLLQQPEIILFLIALTLIVGFLSGFYPAMVLSGYKPVLAMKNQSSSNKSKTRNSVLRKSLTVTQFIIAQFFIMATVLVSKQIYFALHRDLGFKKDAIVYINMPYKVQNKEIRQVFFNRIKTIPGVELTSLGGSAPASNGYNSNSVSYVDGKKEIKTDLQTKSADENFINVYHIKLLAGRNVRMSDTTTSMLINANYAHLLGFRNVNDAISKYITFGTKDKRQIVGIVADFHQGSLHAPIKPLAIFPQTYNFNTVHIALRPETAGGGEWKRSIASMKSAWKDAFPEDDFEYQFFDQNITKFYEKEQNLSTLLSWATGLSILISCLGLLGLAIYTTSLRTKEIGVRKVLGASVTQIVTMLSSELVLLILLAFIIVTPIAWYAMNQWMQGFAERTTVSWWIFAASAVLMLVAAVFTSSFQTIKAAIANPVKSLRSE